MSPRFLSRAARPHVESAAPVTTTSILLGNLHCPSCVSTIRDALHEAFPEHIHWVSPNIVTSVVTVEHDPETSLNELAAVLSDAGFDVCGATSSPDNIIVDPDTHQAPGTAPDTCCPRTEQPGAPSPSQGRSADKAPMATSPRPASTSGWSLSPLARWTSVPRVEQSRISATEAHFNNCDQCRRLRESGKDTPVTDHHSDDDDAHAVKDTVEILSEAKSVHLQRSRSDSSTSIASSSGRFHASTDANAAVRDPTACPMSAAAAGTADTAGNSFITIEDEDAPVNRPLWRATLAIGGMTCAVCVNAITDELKKKDWIDKVTVNLISNSATVDFDNKDMESKIVDAIEDLGYDATLDSVIRLDPPKPARQKDGAARTAASEDLHDRTVEIYIDGIYCEHCPDRVARSLAGFRRPSLAILSKPTPQRPVLKVKYIPDAPAFTIRHILAAIEASDNELSATVYHPPTLEERSKLIQAKHRRQILYRVIFTAIICIPTFVLGIVYMSLLPTTNKGRQLMTAPWTSGISRSQIALFILATPVYFYSANIFHVRALKEIRALWRRGSRTPIIQRFYRFGSMNTLMSLGTTIAYVSSVSQMIAAAAHESTFVSNSNFYFDSVVFLTFFLLCGRLIEAYSKSRTGDAIESLGRLRPNTAILIEGSVTTLIKEKDKGAAAAVDGAADDTEDHSALSTPSPIDSISAHEVEADMLDFGDVVRVPHGASPPADGVIIQGTTNFDESSLTGESRLIPKTAGDEVFSGTVNKDAPILVRVTGTSGRSMLDQIVAVVREGQTKRAPMEQIADLLTTYFVPVVTLVAILTWLIWLVLGVTGTIPSDYLDVSSGGWVAFSLQFAIAVFVVACPCGLGLAAPTAIFVGGGMAAKHGILAKGGGEAFEKASRIDCIVFDKTGTLTMGGEPTVTDAAFFIDDSEPTTATSVASKKADLLAALKAVEESSSHPIAKAIVTFCSGSADAAGPGGRADQLQEIAGRGMRAIFESNADYGRSLEVLVGNEPLMRDCAVAVPTAVAEQLQEWKSQAKSVALLATRPLALAEIRSWTLSAVLAISDPVRPEAAPVIAAIQARGVEVYMLSGDNAVTAAAVAQQLGVPADHVIADVLPTEKGAKIQYLQASLQAHTTRFGRVAKLTSTTSGGGAGDSQGQDQDHSGASNGRRAVVAMVGDGINDSPALTQADVGIAVGSGSDVAISSADFVLVQSNLQEVVTLLDLSKVVFRRIAFNFGWALVYNVLAVPIAAGVLYPISTGSTRHVRLDPVWASLAMALSSISVVTSSLALRSRVPGIGFRPAVVRVPGAEQ